MELYNPLARYALHGLKNCYMADQGCWSHSFHPYKAKPNVSIPHSDVFYTLNVLLGFSQLPDQGKSTMWDVEDIFTQACRRMTSLPVQTYAYGTALWAGAELGLSLPGETVDAIKKLLQNEADWMNWNAQDVGMLISGLCAVAAHAPSEWQNPAQCLKNFTDRYFSHTHSGLFYDAPNGFRRRFSSFATNVYQTLALFQFGERFGDERAIQRALLCVDALARVQGFHGEWPWFYMTPSGKVMEMYPIYSVHQDGMAPAYLHHAIRHGHPTAHDQLVRGFHWIHGNNEMKQSMLVPDYGVVLRAQMRKEPYERHLRAFRSVTNWIMDKEGVSIGPEKLKLSAECRSYHLGWILWSFAGQSDFPELTEMDCFQIEKQR